MLRYYGERSHVRHARARPTSSPALPPAPASHAQDESTLLARRSWARWIKKVYEADPLVCPRCARPMKIISLIDTQAVIEKILRHLKLWDRSERRRPLGLR